MKTCTDIYVLCTMAYLQAITIKCLKYLAFLLLHQIDLMIFKCYGLNQLFREKKNTYKTQPLKIIRKIFFKLKTLRIEQLCV